ncbi:MAG: hypothetical protein LAO09_04435 [Acidobacteriia bacterium]|nr:hypothetical protein [Terriglobia bacterium]
MLHKCANPSCANPFRRLSEGKLFLVETDAVDLASLGRIDGQCRLTRHIEHYWLCHQCAAVLTLSYEKGRGMVTVPLGGSPRKMPAVSIRPAEVATNPVVDSPSLPKSA